MATRERFLSRLYVLAKMCEYHLTKDMVELYDRGMETFGYDRATRAVEEAVIQRRGHEKMPSIGDLVHRCSPQVSEQDTAVEVSGRILSAIARFGYANCADAFNWIGEVGRYVVEINGGWATLCQTVKEKDIPMWKAQLREQAAAAIRRHKAGVLAMPPAFDGPGNQLASLIGDVLKKGEEHAARHQIVGATG